MKMHRFRLIHQKLNQKGYFGHIFVARLFKIQFTTKNFVGKFFMKMHGFRLIYQNLIRKVFWTHFRGTLVQNLISYKKLFWEIFHANE